VGPGDRAPDFTLPDEHGQPRALGDFLAEGPVVLFFYPAASSPGCTKEACHFRDLAAEFAEVGAQRVGVSADAVERQAAFTGEHGFDFPLLSDADGSVARTYGVRRPGPLPNRRATFVVDTDGTLLEVITSELSMDTHADDALAALRQRA